MKHKRLSKDEAKKHSNIIEENYNRVPFVTTFQEEVQNIVKELWGKEETFVCNHNVSWLSQKAIKTESNIPTILLYSKMGENENGDITYKCDDEDYVKNGFRIEILNLENHSPYQDNVKINIIGTDNDDLKGIALVAIMNLFYYNFLKISDLHKKIISIYKSNLDKKIKKYCISSVRNEINEYIEDNNYNFNFVYPFEVIRNLNDLHLYYHEWIEEGDSYIIEIALEYYREIIYYNAWLKKHNVEGKHFKNKIHTLNENYQEIIKYFDMNAPYKRKVPRHPQETLHDLIDRYIDAYGEEHNINDDAVQAIIRIISDYQRMPKKSHSRKEMEAYNNETFHMAETMKQKGASNEEIHTFIINRTFGSFGDAITYVGDQKTN